MHDKNLNDPDRIGFVRLVLPSCRDVNKLRVRVIHKKLNSGQSWKDSLKIRFKSDAQLELDQEKW